MGETNVALPTFLFHITSYDNQTPMIKPLDLKPCYHNGQVGRLPNYEVGSATYLCYIGTSSSYRMPDIIVKVCTVPGNLINGVMVLA